MVQFPGRTSTTRLSIYVNSDAGDAVGKEFTYELRSQIASSALFQLADNKNAFTLQILTINNDIVSDDSNNNSATVMSIVLTYPS